MKTVASKVTFLDLYKEKQSDPGTPCGVCFSFLFIIVALLILTYVLLDSYWNPNWPNSFIGKSPTLKLKDENLDKIKKPEILFECSSTTGCYVKAEPKASTNPCTSSFCSGVNFQTTIVIPMDPYYFFNFYTREIFSLDNETASFGNFYFKPGIKTPVYGKRSNLYTKLPINL
jgi:hypothetical protein